MAPEDNSGARPAGPVVLRIKLRYDDLDAMVQKFASNVGKSGLFLPTKSIQPVGTEVKFELRLTNDVPVLVGMGRVKHVRPPDPDNPKLAFGMAIELMRVSREGREVIIRMIERRRAMGLADVAIPLPEDIEAARRAEVETVPKTDVTDIAREALAQAAATPPPEPVLVAKPASGPIGVAKTAPAATESAQATAPSPSESGRASAPLMTAPRAGSSTMSGARDSGRIAVPVLAPEKSRSRRPRVQDLIEKAAELSARIVVVPELDMQIDVDSVLNRARTLAGGDLDAELETLREAAAAPIEIGIEAASAELARQLGGKPISKRDRSARWAPPPAVELRSEIPQSIPIVPAPSDPIAPAAADTITSAPSDPIAPEPADTVTSAPSDTIAPPASEPSDTIAPDFAARTRAETEAAPSATIAAVVEAAVTAQSPALEPVVEHVVETSQIVKVETSQIETIEPADAAPEPVDAASEPVDAAPELNTRVDASASLVPELNTPVDASAALLPDEYDDAENEYAADERTRYDQDAPSPDTARPAKFLPDVKTDPAADSGLMIDDDADILSFERALDAARIHTGVSTQAAPERPTILDLGADAEESDLFPRVELPSSEFQLPDDGLETETATPIIAKAGGAEFPAISDQLAKQLDDQLAEAEAEAERDIADGIARPRHAEYGEESDEDSGEEISDLDVLAEADEDDEDLMQSNAEADASGSRPSVSDFAARLDLGDDDDDDLGDGVPPPPPEDDFDREDAREFDAQVPPAVEDDYREPPPSYPFQRRRRPSSEQSSNYTIAEDSPPADLHFAPHPSGEDFDEPHRYGSSPSLPTRGPDPRLLRHGRPTTEGNASDLEDALAALDVGDIDLEQQRRMARPTPSTQRPSRPLPGLPIERPKTGQAPIVAPNTVQRDPARATGAQPIATQEPPRPKPPTAQHGTRPPPIPAAARKSPTQQVQIAKPQAPAVTKRAPSEDDGVLIDFDDDE